MSHAEQREFITTVKNRFPEFFSSKKVIEIGSLDINGTVRDFFTDCEYIGVDVGPGPGVDLVSLGHEVDYPDGYFDVSISAECFEHNPLWLETFINMYRMSSGLVVFTCASEGRPEHGTRRTSPGDSPLTLDMFSDYYKNLTEKDFTDVLKFEKLFQEFEFSVNRSSHDLYFWGRVLD